ncbi:MAG: hypothetical protein A2X61_04395 [Ignavibacteria bacterium GWB2_35_12]|nr:MAG: hypothetical protein A2X63_01055 [Ignavibacteria bacterium GWA2_35_8]OGU38928.1 MAG: hypothetical protein A2X61_04395 [Ignavibacteria bacterium GWB2_35_12]OGU88418.1 MAG: hypothetical protein A2220_05105 [Ignavibacteria bacterium RIFOXYA2_FULL_35_10]OGV20406.1 MAG: hypothetical protein A2475_12170 [Ignavibacteria bacterium RIFOXYC2_FULL_35_21]
MQITNVTNTEKNLNSSAELSIEQVRDTAKSSIDKNKKEGNLTSWQKDILLSAIDKLENSIQMDDIHPLSRRDAAPIETYEEALIELNYVKSPKFAQEAFGAQANLNPEDVMYLFTSE